MSHSLDHRLVIGDRSLEAKTSEFWIKERERERQLWNAKWINEKLIIDRKRAQFENWLSYSYWFSNASTWTTSSCWQQTTPLLFTDQTVKVPHCRKRCDEDEVMSKLFYSIRSARGRMASLSFFSILVAQWLNHPSNHNYNYNNK